MASCKVWNFSFSGLLLGWHSIYYFRPRSTRDWFYALRSFAPLCARHPQLFVRVMEKIGRKQKDQINVLPNLAEPLCKVLASSAPVKEVLF